MYHCLWSVMLKCLIGSVSSKSPFNMGKPSLLRAVVDTVSRVHSADLVPVFSFGENDVCSESPE